MSHAASSWVLSRADVRNPTEAMVLMVLADMADRDGHGSYYSRATIATMARVSVSTVARTISALEARGLLVRGDQQLVEHFAPRHRPVVWSLPIGQSEPSDSKAIGQTGAFRGVKSGPSDRSPRTHNPTDNPTPTQKPAPSLRSEAAKVDAKEVTDAWYDWRKHQTGKQPIQPYMAVRKIAERALKAGWSSDAVRRVLASITADGSSVTYNNLSRELERTSAVKVNRSDDVYLEAL